MSSVQTTSSLESPAVVIAECDRDFYEVVDGVKQELPRMGAYENVLASVLTKWLIIFADDHGLGWVTTETLFVLDAAKRLQRRPDVAFVSVERGRASPVRRTNAWDVVPDLAVEIVSTTNFADEIDAKLVDYFAAGVGQVWVIYPETRRLYVHESLQTARGYSEDDLVDAAPVLPGLTFRLADLFDAIENIDEPAE